MWRCSCCWEPQDIGKKPWLSSIATAHYWDGLSLQRHTYGSLGSFPASTPQAAPLWEPCWDCSWAEAQELGMDHNHISHWTSCCDSQQGMAEPLAVQCWHRADSLVCNNISVTLTSTPGMVFEPAYSCICERWQDKHAPMKPGSATL